MIALVGQSVLDRVTLVDGTRQERLGGAPLFAAEALVAHGGHANVATRGGTSELRRPLEQLGLPLWVGPAEHTYTSDLELLPTGDRRQGIGALGDPFTPRDVEGWMAPALRDTRVVVAGAQWREDFDGDVLTALAAGGRLVLLDGQGPARPPRLGALQLEGPLDPAWVRGVHVLKVSEDEADALLGGADPQAALRSGVPVVVVTRGLVGATVLHGGRADDVGVEPVRGLADTVGAGDAFLALLGEALDEGLATLDAVQRACDGVSRLLRARLEAEQAAASGVPGPASP